MKLKRILLSTIIPAVFAISLAACSSSGKITMATNAAFAPFEYITSRDKALIGEYTGVDIAIGLEIAKELDKTLDVQDMEFDAVLTALPQGKADFAAAGLSIDEERLQSMDFSIPYYIAQQVIIVRNDNTTINSANDLFSETVAVVSSFTGETVCIKMGLTNLSAFKQGTTAILELQSGRVGAFVVDLHTAKAFVAQNPDLKIIEDAEAFEKEEYAIAVKKGNAELLETINNVLQRLIDEGQINKWVDEHMEMLSLESNVE